MCASASAAAPLPVDKTAPILVRALAYDRELRSRAGTTLTLAVVFSPHSSSAAAEADRAMAAFRRLEALTVQGLPFRALSLPYGPDLSAKLAEHNVDSIYIVSGLDAELDALLRITRRDKIRSLTGDEDQITRGAAIGVGVSGGKPTILVNLPASRAEGAQLSSELLRLARVIQ